jgi:hypothetical protein
LESVSVASAFAFSTRKSAPDSYCTDELDMKARRSVQGDCH